VVVNYERAWLRLKEHALSRSSHGQGHLLARMAELEIENEVPEGEEGFSSLPARMTDRPARGADRETATAMATH
jgi:hypothetical protein